MRSMALVALAVTALLVTAASALGAWQAGGSSAQPENPLTVGFDMNTTGNTCPGDGVSNCTLGTIDTCVQVPSGGGVVTIDVFLKDLPAVAGGYAGFQYHIGERNSLSVGTVSGITHSAADVNLIVQVPPANVFDFSGPVGTSIPFWNAMVADTGGMEVNPPFTQGVMSRLQIDATGAPDGVYGLIIDPPEASAGLQVLDLNADDYCAAGNPNADSPTTPSPSYVGCNILDANDGYGLIAVGVDCSAGPPLITPTPTPTPTPGGPTPTPPGPTPSTTPTPGTPTPVPPDLVAGWNYACYLGAALPVPEALAHIMPGVQALYHLRADQGYDKWFPARPELSTMTDVSPYEPLFILMANDSDWPQTPADTPPTGLDLAQGWNAACYSGQTKDASSATDGITGQYEALYLLASNQGWKRFIPARPEISNLDQLEQFAAVLVLVTQPEGARWVFDP